MRMLSSIKKYLQRSENFFSLAGNMLFAAFSLVTFLLMVRFLDRELYGSWVIYITAATLLDMLRSGFTGTPAIRLISTTSGTARKRVIAASYQLSGVTTLGLGVLFLAGYALIHSPYPGGYYLPVLLFYPVLALASLPHNQASVVSQGMMNFRRVLVMRAMQGGLNFLLVSGYILLAEATLQGLILMHLLANGLTSLVTVLKSWDGLAHIRLIHKATLRKIMNFGKYATASYIGSNLLRSSDTFLLSMSPVMGAEAIAIYAIPFKLVELVEIPLRSFTATSFPKLSLAYHASKEKFNHHLVQYLVLTVLLLLPVIGALLLFSSPLLQLLGGGGYLDSLQLQKSIVLIVAAYIFFLPFDRYAGVGLLAIDRPRLNFKKIMMMLLANILFDLIAIFVFHSLILVAAATLIFTLAGIGLGWYYLQRESGFQLKKLPGRSVGHIQYIYNEIKNQVHGRTIPVS